MAAVCSLHTHSTGFAQPRRPALQRLQTRSPGRHLGSRTNRSSSCSSSSRRQWVVQAGGGGDGGSGGSSGGSGGGGGGGGDDEQPPEQPPVSPPQQRAWGWKGWQDRVAADPQFVYKMVIEQIIGVTANVVGDMASRPNWGLNELDFVFATLVVGSIINFSAVYLLAPVASAVGGGSAASASFIAKLFGDHYLLKWGAPTGHCFQPGFPFFSRLTNYAYKGVVFSIIGFGAGVVGTATSNGLLALRKRMDPTYSSPNQPPSIVGNASCWALHMGVSANTRYQVLNGLDMVLQPLMPSSLFRLYASVVRGLNNLAGGMSFVVAAKTLGVQKAAEPVAMLPAEAESSLGQKIMQG